MNNTVLVEINSLLIESHGLPSMIKDQVIDINRLLLCENRGYFSQIYRWTTPDGITTPIFSSEIDSNLFLLHNYNKRCKLNIFITSDISPQKYGDSQLRSLYPWENKWIYSPVLGQNIEESPLQWIILRTNDSALWVLLGIKHHQTKDWEIEIYNW